MLIVGLGNPGIEYENTRHNIGFMFIDDLTKSLDLDFKYNKNCQALMATKMINNEKHYFIKPLTYMNNSGISVKKVINYYHLEVSSILVIHDDMDLPLGKIRIRPNGSSGGHKGMASIIEQLGTNEINRIRLGISHASDVNVIDYVLTKFTPKEMDILNPILSLAPDICQDYITNGISYIMNHYNG